MSDRQAAEVLRFIALCELDEMDERWLEALRLGAEALENRDAWETERDKCRLDRDAARAAVARLREALERYDGLRMVGKYRGNGDFVVDGEEYDSAQELGEKALAPNERPE